MKMEITIEQAKEYLNKFKQEHSLLWQNNISEVMQQFAQEMVNEYIRSKSEVLRFARVCICEAMNSENKINFGDVGAWNDCLCEIDNFLNSEQ